MREWILRRRASGCLSRHGDQIEIHQIRDAAFGRAVDFLARDERAYPVEDEHRRDLVGGQEVGLLHQLAPLVRGPTSRFARLWSSTLPHRDKG